MAFQTSVPAAKPAPYIEGGWTGFNPHFTLTNPDEGMWVAGSPGPIIGRFAFANVANGKVTSAHPGASDVRVGFVHRDQPAVITGLLAGDSNQVVAGQGIDLLEDGPVAAKFAAGVAKTGLLVYASYADGSCRAAVTASPATTTYAATTANGSPNLTGVGAGAAAGQPVTGTGIPANTYLLSVSGTTAVMSANATASGSITVTANTDFETLWRTRSVCAAGELAKISVRG